MATDFAILFRPYEGSGPKMRKSGNPKETGHFPRFANGRHRPNLHERGQNMTANWGKDWGKMFTSRFGGSHV